MSRTAPALFASLFVCSLPVGGALAFSQRGGPNGGTPIGHEYITAISALEVLDGVVGPARPAKATNMKIPEKIAGFVKLGGPMDDPGRVARLFSGQTMLAKYEFVQSAVYGQRWVDIGGVNITEALALGGKVGGLDCFNGIAQDPDDLQHDHFLRRRTESGYAGALAAIKDSVARFKKYFIEAALPSDPPYRIRFRDGGMAVTNMDADRHYFLFGRALHLFEDSFSPEHVVRESKGWRKITGIKSYVCTPGSDAHTAQAPLGVTQPWKSAPNRDQDIIWKNISDVVRGAPKAFVESNLTDSARAAIEATKDVWAAFFRVMSLPRLQRAAAARIEANKVAAAWLQADLRALRKRYPASGPAPRGVTILAGAELEKCRSAKPSAERVEAIRKACVANLVPVNASQVDPRMFGIPYDWKPAKPFRSLSATPAR